MKKGMKKFAVMFLAVIMAVMNAVPAFAAAPATLKNTAAGYSVPASMTIRVGEQKKLSVSQPGGKYANVSFQYSSACVTAKGYSAGAYWGRKAEITFTGKAPGTFYAVASLDVHSKAGVAKSSYAKYRLYCKVTVVKDGTSAAQNISSKRVPLQKISMNRSAATVTAGNTVQLSVSCFPANTTDSRTVTWCSSNTGVATVSGGRVSAKKAGTATITARVGSKAATCKVTVKAASSGGSTAAGSYKNVSEAYTLLNTFRTTRSNQWYWNANNKTKVKTYGLKALKKDSSLEKTAKIRAREAWTMYYEKGRATHTRPNGKNCFTAYPAGIKYRGENLGWGYTSCRSAILDPTWGWAETNAGYSGQGHRRNMLNSRFTKVGIACYVKNGRTCWAMCLGN